MNKVPIVIVSMFALILGGCAGYGTSQDTVQTSDPDAKKISMSSGGFFFSPENLTLVKDEPVKITFDNSGTHNFTIDELGVSVSLRGGSPTVEFTPAKSGTFEYYCNLSGHREKGMHGSLTVE